MYKTMHIHNFNKVFIKEVKSEIEGDSGAK